MKLLLNAFSLGVIFSLHPSSTVNAADTCKSDLAVSYSSASTASSQFDPNDKSNNYGPDRAVLNSTETKDSAGITQMGGWVAEKDNFNQWIQVELKDASLIRGLVTQGRNGCCQQWVTRYRVLYSEDCQHWSTVGGFNVTDKFFKANTDDNTPVTNMFHCPVMAKCIRVNPLGWNKNIAMRLGILGCPLDVKGTLMSQSTSQNIPQTTTTQAPVTTQPTTQTTTTQPTTKPTTPQPTTSTTTTTTPTTTTQKQTQPPTTPTTTQAPTTIKTKATPKAGGNVVIPGTGGSNKGACVKSCKGRANGDYQSCTGCHVYVTCVWEQMYDKRSCPNNSSWDDNLKRCVAKSNTCP